jgi:hypothetical protein
MEMMRKRNDSLKHPQSSSEARKDFMRSRSQEKLRSEKNQFDKIIKNFSAVLDERNDINPIKDIEMIKELLNSCQWSHLEELEAKSDSLLFSRKGKEGEISKIKKEIDKIDSNEEGEHKLKKIKIEGEKDLPERDKLILEKEKYIRNQEQGILQEARMCCYHVKSDQSGQEIHLKKTLQQLERRSSNQAA